MGFDNLDDEHANHFYQSGKAKNIENEVANTLGMFRFFGKLVDLYLAKLVDAILEMSKKSESKNTEVPPSPNRKEEDSIS